MRSTKENHISTTQSQIRFGVPSVGTGLLKNIPGARRRQGPHSACSTLTLSCKLSQVLLQGWFCMPCAPPAWAAMVCHLLCWQSTELHQAVFPARRRAFCAQAGTLLGTVGTVGRCSTCYICLVSLSTEGSRASGQCPPPSQHCLSLQTSTLMYDAPPMRTSP